MKKISISLILLTVLSFTSANAQDENNPWAITVGINAVDFFPTGEDAPLGEFFSEFFNVNDHYNIVPFLSSISVRKYIDDGFSFGLSGSLNNIENFGDQGVNNLLYLGIDGIIMYDFSKLINSKFISPYIGIGGGYTWIQEPINSSLIGRGTLNGTAGISFWFNDFIGVTAQSTYKNSFEQEDLASHFQHSLGVSFKFGGKDTDGDGIYDKNDECPDVPGLEAFNGCPDSDGDGIKDSEDECPNEAGLAEFNGCPDSDGDGVQDNKDDCPNEAGLKSLNGCPDADGDGIANGNDNCPNEAGPAANNGCPWPDSDGDGVLDKDDQCPNEAGTVANNGCPEVVVPTEEEQEKLTEFARAINFNSGRSSFRQEAYPTLQAITAILKEYPEAQFRIEGHTDSTGSKSGNQRLSDARAKAVLDYLVENGISADRLTSKGFGQDSPIETNRTRAGRAANRRVEILLNDQ